MKRNGLDKYMSLVDQSASTCLETMSDRRGDAEEGDFESIVIKAGDVEIEVSVKITRVFTEEVTGAD